MNLQPEQEYLTVNANFACWNINCRKAFILQNVLKLISRISSLNSAALRKILLGVLICCQEIVSVGCILSESYKAKV